MDAPKVFDFQELKLTKVINESTLTKSITFSGTYKEQPVVIKLDRLPFEESATKDAINSQDLVTDQSLANDIYFRYKMRPSGQVNDVKAIVVFPANEKVVEKYSRSETVLYTETPDIYNSVVRPFIERLLSSDPNYNLWVYNILEGRSEAMNVILNDTDPEQGFMLIPSLNSSGDEKEIHVLAISQNRRIRSLRDLSGEHLPLLKNIMAKGPDAIKKKYQYRRGELRTYIHYHPTFYHFHVHFVLVDPSEYRASDRDNLLTTVIDNISLMDDYYQRATLTYPLARNSGLYKELDKHELINKEAAATT